MPKTCEEMMKKCGKCGEVMRNWTGREESDPKGV
jgi:hypothetical protein